MARAKIIKNIFFATLWTAIGAGTVVLLVAAIQQKDARQCSEVVISIKGVSNNFFVDRNDILQVISSLSAGQPVGKAVGSFNLRRMETELQKNVWVKSAQLFFDNNEKLQVTVTEREPIARVFSTAGTTFYIDSSTAMLPLSDKFSARLPVFTSFPSDKKVLTKADSNLLRCIQVVSTAIQKDSFSMAMIDQVDITPQRNFEMIPKFGNTVIVFGDAKNADEKIEKIRLFYQQVVTKAGWNKYSEINVQYANQVVGKRKGAAEVKADSLHTLQLMKSIAETAERLAADTVQTIASDNAQNTTDNSIIQQSIERDDDDNSTSNSIEEPKPQDTTVNVKSTPVKVPVIKPAAPAVSKTVVPKKGAAAKQIGGEKPGIKPTTGGGRKPDVLMPKPGQKLQAANEY